MRSAKRSAASDVPTSLEAAATSAEDANQMGAKWVPRAPSARCLQCQAGRRNCLFYNAFTMVGPAGLEPATYGLKGRSAPRRTRPPARIHLSTGSSACALRPSHGSHRRPRPAKFRPRLRRPMPSTIISGLAIHHLGLLATGGTNGPSSRSTAAPPRGCPGVAGARDSPAVVSSGVRGCARPLSSSSSSSR